MDINEIVRAKGLTHDDRAYWREKINLLKNAQEYAYILNIYNNNNNNNIHHHHHINNVLSISSSQTFHSARSYDHRILELVIQPV